MPEIGGPNDWPVWCMGVQPTRSSKSPRLRVVTTLRFFADQFADEAGDLSGRVMDVWRDDRGRWSISPKEDD